MDLCELKAFLLAKFSCALVLNPSYMEILRVLNNLIIHLKYRVDRIRVGGHVVNFARS